jgi:hypothetical protein
LRIPVSSGRRSVSGAPIIGWAARSAKLVSALARKRSAIFSGLFGQVDVMVDQVIACGRLLKNTRHQRLFCRAATLASASLRRPGGAHCMKDRTDFPQCKHAPGGL